MVKVLLTFRLGTVICKDPKCLRKGVISAWVDTASGSSADASDESTSPIPSPSLQYKPAASVGWLSNLPRASVWPLLNCNSNPGCTLPLVFVSMIKTPDQLLQRGALVFRVKIGLSLPIRLWHTEMSKALCLLP